MGSHTVHTCCVPGLCSRTLAWWWLFYSRKMLPKSLRQTFVKLLIISIVFLDGNKYHCKGKSVDLRMREIVRRLWSLFRRLRFYFLLFCSVDARVNQKERCLVLFLWNRRSKQAVVQRNSSTLSCDSCGHKSRNPWTRTNCDPVWYVSYCSQTALAVEPWLRALLGEYVVCPSDKFINDVDRDVDKMLREDTLVSLSWHSACLTIPWKPSSRIGFKDRASPSATMAAINRRRLW